MFIDLIENILKSYGTKSEDCQKEKAVGHFWLRVLEPSDSTNTMANFFPRVRNDKKEEGIFYFILENCSANQKVGFDQLKGKDHLLAQLFQCFSLYSVHLAVLTQYTAEYPPGIRQAFEFEQWTDVTNRPVELKNLKVDFLDKLVGEPYNLLKPLDDCLKYVKNCEGKTLRCYQRVALVIWTKTQTDRIYCQYGFQSLLSRISRQSSSAEIGLRRKVNLDQDLPLAIGFCRTQPLMTWKNNGDVILSLLKLCTRMRYQEQGFALLNLSGIEGIFNKEIIKAVAKFVHQLAGNGYKFLLFSFFNLTSNCVYFRLGEFFFNRFETRCLVSSFRAIGGLCRIITALKRRRMQ